MAENEALMKRVEQQSREYDRFYDVFELMAASLPWIQLVIEYPGNGLSKY